MVFQVVPSLERSMLYADAYAVSQFSTTQVNVAGPPRSTDSHCGSLYWLSQRVVVRPSSAAAGALPPLYEDALTGWKLEITGSEHAPAPPVPPPPPPLPELNTWNSQSE